jgi:ABC-type transport system substrate-binding protein
MLPRASQVGGVAAIALAVAACDSPARVKPWRHAPDPTAEAAAAPVSPVLADTPSEADVHAAREHTLRIHVDAEPGRLNPVVAPSVWARRIMLGTVFEPLLRYVPADGQSPAHYGPRLAASWHVGAGGLEILVELAPNVTFHDGRPMTSSDVQFTLDAVRDPRKGVEHLRGLLDDVEAIELAGPLSVRIRLKRPSGWALRALAEIPILPMHVYDGSLLAGGALVGTGPWKLASNKAGIVHLARNDKYWGKPPAIADLEFVYEPDAAVALTEAKHGQLDIVPALIPAHWPEQATAPGIAASFRPLALVPPRLRYLTFNTARSPLDDARVRHALALLVDRRAIAKRVWGSLARPVLWPIWPGGPVAGAEATVPDFDPAAAGKLLEAAGWIDSDKDGIRDKDGKQLRLVMIGGERPPGPKEEPPKKTERDLFVDAAKRAGVVIEVKTGGDAFLQKRLADGSYDLVEQTWSGMADGEVSALVGKDPRVARVLDALAAAPEPADRAKLAGDLVAALAEVWPLAGVVAEAPQGLVHRRVAGVVAWDGWIDLTALRFEEK